MRLITALATALFALSVTAAPADAQGRANGQTKRQPTTTVKARPEKVSTTPVRTTTPKAEARPPKAPKQARPPKAPKETRPPKAVKEPRPPKAPQETRPAKAPAEARAPKAEPTVRPVTEVTPTTPTTRTVKNPRLEARLQTLLPAGTTVQDASAGFKNWGQFVAAVHVSNNLGIPFADLKAKMTGLTPGTTPGSGVQGPAMSLGQAIQSLKGGTTTDPRPLTDTRIRSEVKKAEDAATADLKQTRERS